MATARGETAQPCPVARSVEMIGERWALLIVRDAFDGVRRFGDFQRSLGVARNILSDRLRRLLEAQILELQPAADGSAYQEYALTDKGEQLFPLVVALRQWGERHLFAPGEAHSRLLDRRSGKPVPAMAPRDSAGRVLKPRHTLVRKVEAPAADD
ncbi:helix-turn-helix transcriptional regulator [Xanthomonas sp. AmX2]|uniref:winged helix-turn-helix transcriptional regulator n=1 Tax=Xanthomonas sp. TaxID=29446 RepID=UPI001980BC18|nr:helix-turn-helix domain-containing protein [Xanthomonas sp.]MBN6149792.1 helix-turn-helix transcriptional regulator [Xanthomonas sp.]